MTSSPARRIGAIAGNVVAVLASLLFTIGVGECALRSVPALLPAGTYTLGQRFDEAIGSPVYDGKVIYNKVRRQVRAPNVRGFMDVEHDPAKPKGVRRVGLFGDSFVESVQVPLEQTFFRRLAGRVEADGIAPLAFGISGWGTLHSYLAWRELSRDYELDLAAYVFVENDLGDNAFSIQGSRRTTFLQRPFAELAEEPPGWRIHWVEGIDAANPLFGLVRRATDGSLLARVVWSRLLLLYLHGVSAEEQADAKEMVERVRRLAMPEGVPNQNDLPSTWPPRYAREATELGRRILTEWSRQARERGIDLFVIYVPRGQSQLRGELAPGDTWKPWLLETCAGLSIPVVDLTDPLAARLAQGEDVYDDHWSPAGHEVVAQVLADWLLAHEAARP